MEQVSVELKKVAVELGALRAQGDESRAQGEERGQRATKFVLKKEYQFFDGAVSLMRESLASKALEITPLISI